MVDQNNNPEPEEVSNADAQWEAWSNLLPEREDVDLPEEEISDEESVSHGSLSQQMRNSPKLSDAQTFDKRLFPKMKTEWLDVLQVSRVFPDNFNDLFIIFVKDLMSEYKDMTLGESIAYVTTALTIAIDGEGRLDELALAGSANAKAEDDKGI